MDFDQIDPYEPDDDDIDNEDDQQPLISESSEEHIPLVRRKTTTSQEYNERGQTAETLFITGEPSGNIIREPRILLANEKLQDWFPDYGKKGFLDLEVVKKKDGTSKVQIRGPYGGKYNLFTETDEINPKLPKSTFDILGPSRKQFQQENAKLLREVENKIAQNEEVANDQNEDEYVRSRAREKIYEGNERLAELERENERLEPKSLREKIKDIFRKYGFTVGAIALAVGATIGVIINSLSKGLKSVAGGIGNGLKTLGKKIGEILLGMLGPIVSFILRSAGEIIKFLGKNAWLLILAVAAFIVEQISKR